MPHFDLFGLPGKFDPKKCRIFGKHRAEEKQSIAFVFVFCYDLYGHWSGDIRYVPKAVPQA